MKFKTFFSLSGMFFLFLFSSGFVESKQEPQNKNGGKASFAEFLSHFEKVETPFEVNLKNNYKYEDQKTKHLASMAKSKSRHSKTSKSTSTDNRTLMRGYIPELKSGMFSRSGPPEVLPVARFYPNDKMIAVIYMTYHPFRGERMSEYVLTLYDLKGNIVKDKKDTKSKEEVDYSFQSGFTLAFNSYRETETFSIDKKGQIWKKTYKNIWKNDIKNKGLEGNEIVGYDLKGTEVFQIQANGLVEASKSYNVEDRASLD